MEKTDIIKQKQVNEEVDAGLSPLCNLDAERSVLGVLMLSHSLIERIEYLKPEHFYEPINQLIFAKIKKMHENGLAATREAFLRELLTSMDVKDKETTQKIATHITNCWHASTTVINPEGCAQLIIDLHIKRQLVDASRESISDACSRKRDEKALTLIEQAEHRLFQIATHGDYKKNFIDFDSLMSDTLKNIDHNFKNKRDIIGVPTGLFDLDSKLSGLQNSDLIIVAGRPSMGKTALAVNMAFNACVRIWKEDRAIAFFSLEMSSEQLINRIISMNTGINSFKLRSGAITQHEYDAIVKWREDNMKGLPFFIDDTAGLTISSLKTRARKLARKHNLGAIFIDYLQLIHGGENYANKVQEITQISKDLKNLAKELNIPVVALSQLSRAVEQREDKRPLLSDLRESGSIEQDADVVMFVYREEYYTRRTQPKEGTPEHDKWREQMNNIMNQAEVIIAKQRNGPIANVKLYYDSNTTSFSNVYSGNI